jgi:HlyD family secretion protein
VIAGLAWFAWPRPVAVDLAPVTKGPMEVTVDDEAKTRVRHVYTVSAPIAGKVLRISHPLGEHGVSIHVGDQVRAAETVVAIMQPTVPSFLDARSREELQAMLTAADAAVALAEAEVRRIEAALEFSRGELRRAEMLARTNSIPERSLEKARLDVQTSEAALASAKAQLDVRRSERASVAARLIDPTTVGSEMRSDCCIQLRSPVTGVVLKIIQDSEATVLPGAPLIDIGDPLDLEVVADLLSTDAVQVSVGAAVGSTAGVGCRFKAASSVSILPAFSRSPRSGSRSNAYARRSILPSRRTNGQGLDTTIASSCTSRLGGARMS